MSMLQGMTESLFSETLKRIAEDVWGKKFTEAVKSLKDTGYGNGYGNQLVLQKIISDAFIDCLKKDPELKQVLEKAIGEAAREYFQLKVSK